MRGLFSKKMNRGGGGGEFVQSGEYTLVLLKQNISSKLTINYIYREGLILHYTAASNFFFHYKKDAGFLRCNVVSKLFSITAFMIVYLL